ncbi:hypothetical protein TSA1_08295 [Bradyrhizobium nitroreducens]|uniref:Uncharacterized protein n=1 Tax=Bradyrhizobium nitroreducens TaxID=709803 RepID=A0A2M6U8E2_9BRAD|nr:hypothetical protein TSA1_08295 [Bradyrhizobium nitroreducens]
MPMERFSSSECLEKTIEQPSVSRHNFTPSEWIFFDQNETSRRLLNQPALPQGAQLRALPYPSAIFQACYPEDEKWLPRNAREPEHFDLVDRIPDQEEAAFTAETYRPTKVGAELAAPEAR